MTATSIDCSIDGHCWHDGTSPGSLYCCKCGHYLIPTTKWSYRGEPVLVYQEIGGLPGNWKIQNFKISRILRFPEF